MTDETLKVESETTPASERYMVCTLFGLTEDEIAIVEGRAK